jgi:glutathione S-transferase
MKLFDLERSGNCYKVRLLLGLLGLSYERVTVDLDRGEHTRPEFLHLNPRGQIPVLDDDGTIVWDSMAILVYLARKHGPSQWLPEVPLAMARVMQWLAVSENELLYGLATARAIIKLGRKADYAAALDLASQGLSVLEQRLQENDWLAADQVTIADVACFPYVALMGDARIDPSRYPAIERWVSRILALPGCPDLPVLPDRTDGHSA